MLQANEHDSTMPAHEEKKAADHPLGEKVDS